MSLAHRQFCWMVVVPAPVVIGVLVAAPPCVRADEEKLPVGRIVVPLDGPSAAVGEDVDYKVEKILRKDPRLAPAEVSSRAVESIRFEAGKLAQEAADNLALGVAAFGDLNLEQAVVLFRKSSSAFADGPASAKHSKEYVKALFYLGAALASSDQKDAARDAFFAAVAYDDKLEPDQAIFPPPVIEAFNDARRSMMTELKGTVKVDSMPAGARVYVNGRYAGVTPLQVRNLYPVGAIVRIEKAGYVPFVQRTKITPSGEEEIRQNLVPIPEVLTSIKPLNSLGPGAMAETLSGRALDLPALTGAPLNVFVFVSAEGGGRIEAYLYRDRALVRYASGPWTAADAGAKDSAGISAVMGKILGGDLRPSEVDRPVIAKPWYKTWWFWTAAAGAAVVTTAVLMVVLWPEEQQAPQGGRLVITF